MPSLIKVSIVEPPPLLPPILTLALLLPPISVPWFLKVEMEFPCVKFIALALALEAIILPPLSLVKVFMLALAAILIPLVLLL
ncbi:hypothetical protein [Campylobacter sp. TTU_617]|uniref:hypothetical protein n=1 Tax=Campylobacter sp. TTU_617 TaxID=2768148 RepID=UPI001905868C|nr:hypothetical protein [Campylobacter sp. TTU_617]MBK1971976.1 hypothetical protein [Campylobacter sp. TTU_617]